MKEAVKHIDKKGFASSGESDSENSEVESIDGEEESNEDS
jgi:hypothetical protein